MGGCHRRIVGSTINNKSFCLLTGLKFPTKTFFCPDIDQAEEGEKSMRLKNEMALSSSSSSSYTYVGKRKKEEGEKVQDLETRRREKRGEFLLLSRRLRAEEKKKLDRLWTDGPTDRPTGARHQS